MTRREERRCCCCCSSRPSPTAPAARGRPRARGASLPRLRLASPGERARGGRKTGRKRASTEEQGKKGKGKGRQEQELLTSSSLKRRCCRCRCRRRRHRRCRSRRSERRPSQEAPTTTTTAALPPGSKQQTLLFLLLLIRLLFLHLRAAGTAARGRCRSRRCRRWSLCSASPSAERPRSARRRCCPSLRFSFRSLPLLIRCLRGRDHCNHRRRLPRRGCAAS